ncbi:MAG: TIGR04086 family membrane protein [Desulfitobacteriia bacterium]|jgi:putative membrane protein (TIGR04086 family)
MSKSFKITNVLKGILIAVILSFVLTLLLSLIYHFTSLQESVVHSLVIAGVSILAASFYIAFHCGSKGLYYGLTIGFGFFLLNLAVYYIFYAGDPSWKMILSKLALSILAGSIGGTIGAILKR